jgi:hypothetical protein
MQNVHEHTVAAATRVEIDQLLRKHGHIQLLPALEAKGNARKVYESLSDQKHSAFGISEQEALALVHAEIDMHVNRENLQETLMLRLQDCIESGKLVCSTGKIVRIVSVLQGDEDATRMRPIWAVKEEIAALANVIRGEHLRDASADDVRMYEEGVCDTLSRQMLSDFEMRVRKQYVEELRMSPDVIAPVVTMYTDAF